MAVKKQHSSRTDIINYLGLVAIVILFNYVSSFFFGRFDLTEDKRHSLSDNTIALLEDENRIKDRIFFRIYLEGDLPADIMKIRISRLSCFAFCFQVSISIHIFQS